ncbi:MAG: chloride channel protein [bacterium]
MRVAGKWLYVPYRRFWSSETAVLTALALVIGVGSGFGAIVFRMMIEFFRSLSFDRGGTLLGFMGRHYVIVVPAAGGLIVGAVIRLVGREMRGHGVPEVMEAVALRGGRIRPVVVIGKTLASSVCIGTGGSVGREGPIVQIGSALGSTIGQALRLSERRIKNLVACGAAGGIAATFNAPIAGVVFALEVILRDFTIRTFSTIVVASVIATVISRIFLGNFPAFQIPHYSLVSPWELALYLVLGLLAAFTALLYVRSLYACEDVFGAFRFPEHLKPAAGGLIVGALGLYLPQVFGVGYGTIELALVGKMTFGLLVVLVFAKILAVSVTIGSGGSGGVFAPALFIGAMLGGAFGAVAKAWFPGVTAESGAYALVGMGALFAGAARAPVTSILILFEMTQDYRIILPLMFATVVSTVVADLVDPESIYTHKLKRRGVDLYSRRDLELLGAIRVEEAMKPVSKLTTVPPDMPLDEIARLFRETFHHGFAVVDAAGRLYGVITLHDLEQALKSKRRSGTVADICVRHVVTAYPDDTLEDVMRRFGAMDIGRIPVVDRANPGRLVGMLRWSDIVRAYSQVMLDTGERRDHMERLRLETATSAHLVEFVLGRNDGAVGKTLRELHVPPDCVIASILRGRHVVVPRGDTELREGDKVVAMAAPDAEKALKKCLRAGEHGPGERRS